MYLSQPVSDAMDAYLPEDPLPNQVVEVPEGVDGGAVTHITIYDKNRVVGETQQLFKVENVSSKWQLGRTITVIPLLPENDIRVCAVTKHFASLIFVEFFGWTGYRYLDNETVISDRIYEIHHAAQYLTVAKGPYVYELVCLHHKKEGDEQ